MARERVQVSITLPAELLERIDRLSQEWFSDRSNTIKRIYLEWEKLNPPSLTPVESPEMEQVQC